MNNIFNNIKQRKIIFSKITQNNSVGNLMYDFENNFLPFTNNYFTQFSKYAISNICTVLYFNISAKDPKNKSCFNSHRTYSPFSYDNIKTKSINKMSKFDSSQNIFHF